MSEVRQPLYTLHYLPPKYPDTCFPGRCRHDPKYLFSASVRIREDKRRKERIEIDHAVCLACGLPQPCSYGGNVLVDCQMILQGLGQRHPLIMFRVQQIRGKWAKIATHLFDKRGWNGRHEKIARIIDPKLTMKLRLYPVKGTKTVSVGKISFDPDYLRPDE